MISRKLLGLISHKPDKAYNGYTLFTPMNFPDGVTYLIDMEGRIVHRWELGGMVRAHAELLPNGNLLMGLLDPTKGPPPYAFVGAIQVEMDWDGNVVWTYDDYWADTHDRIRLENGNTMIMHHVDVPDDLAKKVQGGIPGSVNAYGFEKMHSYTLQEISPEGKVVKEIEMYKKLDPVEDRIFEVGTRGVWPGLNSIEELPNGDIMSTAYNCNQVYVFDRETGDVKWRWGRDMISFPHDPTFLDNGNVLLLDCNRFPTLWMPPDGSRVIEVNPNTNEVEWEWKSANPVDFHNTYMGGVQRLPNGNTLVCQGGRGNFFEIAPDGDIVWEYTNPFYCQNEIVVKRGFSNAAFRAYRIGPDHPALQGKDLNPAKYNTWNASYGPGVAAGADSRGGTAAAGATSLQPGKYESKAPSLGKTSGADKVADRAQMLGY